MFSFGILGSPGVQYVQPRRRTGEVSLQSPLRYSVGTDISAMPWQHAPDQAAEEHPPLVPFFAYGTFRPDAASYFRIADLVVGEATQAQVRGRLVMSSAGKWPLLVPGNGEVVGDVLPLRAEPALWSVLGSWEVGWGYSLRWLPTIAGHPGRVLACVWEWPDYLGAEIASGDWTSPT